MSSGRVSCVGHVALFLERMNACKVLMFKSLVKIPLGRTSMRWEDNITLDLREVGCEDRKWLEPAQDLVQWWLWC
jgi:hypothetical protein